MNSSLNFAFPRYLTARDYSREGRDLINPKFHSKGYFHAINTNFLIAIGIEKDLLNFPIFVRINFFKFLVWMKLLLEFRSLLEAQLQ